MLESHDRKALQLDVVVVSSKDKHFEKSDLVLEYPSSNKCLSNNILEKEIVIMVTRLK